MSYLQPEESAAKMVAAMKSRSFMATKDTRIRASKAGGILALAAGFAATIRVNTGNFLITSLLFPLGFCSLCLLGSDLQTGVFTPVSLAVIARRPGCTGRTLQSWT